MVVGCQPYAPAAFTPRKYSWYSFLSEAESTPGQYCDRKDFMSMKNPVTPAGNFFLITTYFYSGTLRTFQHICNSYCQHHSCRQNVHGTRDIITPHTNVPSLQHSLVHYTRTTRLHSLLPHFALQRVTMLARIERATFRSVAQHLNHCATAVPNRLRYYLLSRPTNAQHTYTNNILYIITTPTRCSASVSSSGSLNLVLC